MQVCPFFSWNHIISLSFWYQQPPKYHWNEQIWQVYQQVPSENRRVDFYTVETILTVLLFSFHKNQSFSYVWKVSHYLVSPQNKLLIAHLVWQSYLQVSLLSDTYIYIDTYTCCLDHWQHSGSVSQHNYLSLPVIFSWEDGSRMCIW